MAEDTPTASAPASDATESVKRAPADPKESTAEASKGTEEKANGSEEKSSDATVPEEKKESDKAPAEKPSASEPTDAKEGAVPADAEANGTPASAKKSGGSRRKSTGAVPEHKSKLNRRKSQARITNLHAKPGEYFLARLRSYPPWPSIICDEEMLPQTLLETRPVTALRTDGTYREDYADGGKRAHERTFPVMFFETNEFAWIPNTDLTPLDPATCKEVSEKGKSKLLVAAYGVAADGHDLQHFKTMLADHQRAIEQEEEEREAQAAAKAAAKAEREAKKNKRKSMEIIDDEDVDMEDADEEAKKPKSSKKRKKDAEADTEEKPAKTPKTGTKLKLTTPKSPASEKKTPASSKVKQTASSKKSSKAAAASDEGEESPPAAPKEPERRVNPEEAKAKKEKEILFVRHRLQKGFISRDQPPQEEEMTLMSTYFTKLENYQDLEVSIIRSTKINKVLKMIVKLSSIPRDEEFQFRRRAVDLLSKWKTVLDADTTVGASVDKKMPRANGVHKEDSVETPVRADTEPEKEDDSKLSKSETKDEEMTDADAKEKSEVPGPKEESEKTTSKGDEPSVEKTTEEKRSEEKEKPAAKKAEGKAAEASA